MSRKRSLREKLEVARAELRGTRAGLVGGPLAVYPADRREPPPPDQFVQIVAVNRGYTGILHALDASGQVWQQRTILGPKEAGGKAPVQDQWWEKVEMKRK